MKSLWNKFTNWLNTGNHLLWIAIVALMVIGFISVYFVGGHILFNKYWPYALVGFLLMVGSSFLSKKAIVRISWVLGIFGFLLILKTFFVPEIIKGAARYVTLIGVPLDPFAITLPAYIVLMSHWLSKDKANKTWTTIGATILTLFIIFAALKAPYVFMVQLYLFLFIILGFCARKNNPGVYYTSMTVLIFFIVMGVSSFLGIQHVQYRMLHVGDFVTHMSTHAIASSALIGSTSESLTALARLPSVASDFMFTGIIAKFGLLMGALVLALYGFVARRLLRITRTTKDQFTKILSGGALGAFAIYVIMALFVAFEMLPTAAYWPFIGFCGTMLLSWCILFGFVFATNRK